MSTKLATAFLDRVQRSGLVAPSEMPQVRQTLEDGGVDWDDPQAIAGALVASDVLTRWQADKVLEGKHKGFFIGSYRLLRPLGRGGMGAVFLARHEMMRRQCAIKVLPHSQIKEGSSVLKRFYVEAQAVAALDHPNIVRAYDVNRETKDGKEVHYLVMEFVEGRDLQNLVQERGPLDFVTAAEYLRQTANGLSHAHQNGLVHRDIKPANLLIDNNGVVKILDLGLARFFDDGESASLTTDHNETVLGTADYLSPEQALNSHTVDHRTDIYSLGCTAYYMLTGHGPFPEGSVAQRLIAHQVKTPKPIGEERRNSPRDLIAIIDKMMAKNPADRYATSEELSAVLSKWLIEHGDDDWKRQHSEVLADKAVMSLLSRGEPTRAMASPMSETELELAPLEDDEVDEQDQDLAPPQAPGHVTTDRSERRPPSDPGAPSPGKPHRKQGAHGSAAKSPERTLPPNDSRPPDDPWQQDELFPSTEASDTQASDLEELNQGQLDSFDQSALPEDPPADDPLGVMDSSLQSVVLSSGSSGSHSHRRSAAQPSKNSWFANNPILLPILIGGAGGLLVVLLLLALVFMSSRPTSFDLDAQPSLGEIAVREEAPPEPAPPRDVAEPGTDVSRAPEERLVADPQEEEEEAKPEPEPDREAPSPDESPETPRPEEEPSEAREPESLPGSEDDAEPDDPAVEEEPSPVVDIVTHEDPDGQEPDESAVSDEETAAPAVEPRDPQHVLASMDRLRVDLRGGPGRAKLPPDFLQFLQTLHAAIQRITYDTVQGMGLELDPEAPVLLALELVIDFSPEAVVVQLQGELLLEEGDDDQDVPGLQLWSDEKELARVSGRFNRTVQNRLARENLQRFMNDFQRHLTETREQTRAAGD